MRSPTLLFFVSRISQTSFPFSSPLCPCTEGTAWDFHLWESVFSIGWRVIISWAHESVTREGGGSVCTPEIKGQTFGFSCLSCWCAALSYTSSCLCVSVCLTFKCVYMCVRGAIRVQLLSHDLSSQKKKHIKNYSSSSCSTTWLFWYSLQSFGHNRWDLWCSLNKKIYLMVFRKGGWNLSGNQTYQMKRTQKHNTSFTTPIHE